MTSIYLIDVVGSTGFADPLRPNTTEDFSCLMIDPIKKRALIVSSSDTIATGNARRLIQGSSMSNLRGRLTTSPSQANRGVVASWLAINGYPPLPGEAVNWRDLINYVARMIEPAANVDFELSPSVSTPPLFLNS